MHSSELPSSHRSGVDTFWPTFDPGHELCRDDIQRQRVHFDHSWSEHEFHWRVHLHCNQQVKQFFVNFSHNSISLYYTNQGNFLHIYTFQSISFFQKPSCSFNVETDYEKLVDEKTKYKICNRFIIMKLISFYVLPICNIKFNCYSYSNLCALSHLIYFAELQQLFSWQFSNHNQQFDTLLCDHTLDA